jgi:DNA-binding MarR family transcriptional regulator
MDFPLLDRLLAIGDLLQRDMERAFAGTPLTPSRVAVLWTIHHGGPSTQRAVATALEVSAKNVSVLVDALEETGYVRRAANPADGRSVLLELTPRAEELMITMSAQHAELRADLASAVDAGDLAAVERGVDRILGRLRELTGEAEATP